MDLQWNRYWWQLLHRERERWAKGMQRLRGKRGRERGMCGDIKFVQMLPILHTHIPSSDGSTVHWNDLSPTLWLLLSLSSLLCHTLLSNLTPFFLLLLLHQFFLLFFFLSFSILLDEWMIMHVVPNGLVCLSLERNFDLLFRVQWNEFMRCIVAIE